MEILTSDIQETGVVERPRAARAATVDFIWADKAGILIGASGCAIMAYLWALAVIAAGLHGANHLFQHEIGPGLECDFAAASSMWVFLRMVDLASGGPRRRARRGKPGPRPLTGNAPQIRKKRLGDYASSQ
jgi:hypothetical protein